MALQRAAIDDVGERARQRERRAGEIGHPLAAVRRRDGRLDVAADMAGAHRPGLLEGGPGGLPAFVEHAVRPVEGDELGRLAAHRGEPPDLAGHGFRVEHRQDRQDHQPVGVAGVELHHPVVVDAVDLVAQRRVVDVPLAGGAEPDIAVDAAVIHVLQQEVGIRRRQAAVGDARAGPAEELVEQGAVVGTVGGAAVAPAGDLAFPAPEQRALVLDHLGRVLPELRRDPVLPQPGRDPALVEMVVGGVVLVERHRTALLRRAR